MRNQVTMHPTAVIAVLMLVGICAYFTLTGYREVRQMKEKVESDMNRLKNVVKEDVIFQYVFAAEGGFLRHFYIYSQNKITVDGDITDWEAEHVRELRDGQLDKLDHGSSANLSQSWLDSDFIKVEPPALYFTPYTINTIRQMNERRGFKTQHIPSLRLRFARSNSDSLYMLGHMVNVGPKTSVSISLTTVHYSGRKKQEQKFVIAPKKDGNLRIYKVTPNEKTISGFNYKLVPSEEAFGNWLESGSGDDEFFELALLNVGESDAIALIADLHEGNDALFRVDFSDDEQRQALKPLFRMDSPDPISLQGPIASHAINKLLRHFPRYEVSRGGQVLLSGSQAADERSDTRTPWLLKPIYRFSLFFNNIKDCSSRHVSDSVCFGFTSAYWLSQKKPLEESEQKVAVSGTQSSAESDRRGDDVIMVATGDTLVIDFPGMPLVIPAIVLMVILLALFDRAERRRRHAYRRLEQTNEELELARNELEQSNEKLELTNGAVSSYAETSLHQAKHLIIRLNNRAHRLANSTDSIEQAEYLKVIDNLAASVRRRLEDSKDKFRYEETVSRKIVEHKQRSGFDVYESLVKIVDDFEDRNVQLRPPKWEGRRSILSATGSGLLDQGGETRDGYFIEAIETIIRNAIDYRYRRPAESTIIVSLEVEQDWVVLRVSNDGPTVPEDKLEHVFNMGASYGGTAEDSSLAPAPQDGKDHLGLGLFLLNQIVRAYQGSCRLDNRPDESGVVVTVRLPVAFSPDTVLHHQA